MNTLSKIMLPTILLNLLPLSMANAQEFANLNFSETDSSGFARGWETKPEKINAVIATSDKSPGKALKLTKSKSFQQLFFQRQKVDFDEPKHFLVTADIKTKGIPGFPSRGVLLAHVNDAAGTMIFYDDKAMSGAEGWQTYTLDVYVPRNAAKITIGGGLNGKGTIWFDRFTFEEVPMDTVIHMSEEAQIYLDEAINRIQEDAIAKEKVDFESIRQFAYLKANGADSIGETYSAIRLVIQMMADGHSKFITAEELEEALGKSDEENVTNTDDSDWEDVDFHERLMGREGNRIAYLSVPSFASVSMRNQRRFADELQAVIQQLDNSAPKGWIVDLRQDNGGSNGAMLLGLAPLFDRNEGEVFGYTDNSQEATFWRIDSGKVYVEDTLILASQVNYRLRNPTSPMAVLTGPITQSAGEAMAAAFVGKSKAKLFGLPTAGATHGNELITLSDGAAILLSSGYLVDRNKKVYRRGLTPDVSVSSDVTKKVKLKRDSVVQEAILWIEGRYEDEGSTRIKDLPGEYKR